MIFIQPQNGTIQNTNIHNDNGSRTGWPMRKPQIRLDERRKNRSKDKLENSPLPSYRPALALEKREIYLR